MKKVNKKRKLLIAGSIVVLSFVLTALMLSSSLFAATTDVSYTISNDWGSGASVNVSIENKDSKDIEKWKLTWTFDGDQVISSMWNANFTQNGNVVTVEGTDWNSTIYTNSSVNFGFNLTYSSDNDVPTDFTVNGFASDASDTAGTSTSTSTSESPSVTDKDDIVWSSSEQWGNWSDNNYTLYNNIWGSGAGSQTIWAYSYSHWGVNADHPNNSGIKSYPNCDRVVDTKISKLNTCKSVFDCSVPSSGSYNTAYDIWCDDYAYEIMLWMNWNGEVGPIAGSYDASGNPVAEFKNLTVGGNTWNVYKGSNGYNAVYSFLRTKETNSGSVDIKAICNWLKNEGWFGDVVLDKVQLGWEITSSSGGLDFEMNDYSVDFN